MSNNSMPIAVFDSGIGGITVLKELIKILPNENYIYFSDNANMPYGNKSNDEILKLTTRIVDFFIQNKAKLIVIACNTITAAAYETLKEKYDLPIIDVISNGVKQTLNTTKNNNITLMATVFTVNSEIYVKQLKEHNKNIKITQIASKELCHMIENDWDNNNSRFDVLEDRIKNIDSNSDTFVLACTHYPLIIDDIKKVLDKIPNNINNIVDPAYSTSVYVKEYLYKNNIQSDNTDSTINIYATAEIDNVQKLLNKFFPASENKEYNLSKIDI